MIKVPTESRIFNCSRDKVYDASINALKNSGFKVTEKSADTIKASSEISIRSWGEEIQVKISSTAKGTKVKVTSEPAAQLFDLGKSEENISRFLYELKKQLGE